MTEAWEPRGGNDWYLTPQAREAESDRHRYNRRPVGPMELEGVFHPHLPEGPGSYPIEVNREWLGQTYLSRIGDRYAEVSLPRDHPVKVSDERGLAPPLFSTDPDDWESWSFPAEPSRPKWGDSGGTRGRPRVRDLRLAIDTGADDPADVAREVHESIGPWWRLARTWIELLSIQDLQGADRFHWASGSLALWSPTQTGLQTHADRSRLRQSPRLSLDFGMVGYLGVAFHTAGLGHQPPLEWQTLREAKSAFDRGHYRSSVIDDGQAAEMALLRHLRRLRPPVFKRGEQTPTLGGLVTREIKNANEHGRETVVPDDFRSRVVKLRNDVMHKGASVDEWQAAAAFEVTKMLVATVLPRSYLCEPYGLVIRQDPAATP